MSVIYKENIYFYSKPWIVLNSFLRFNFCVGIKLFIGFFMYIVKEYHKIMITEKFIIIKIEKFKKSYVHLCIKLQKNNSVENYHNHKSMFVVRRQLNEYTVCVCVYRTKEKSEVRSVKNIKACILIYLSPTPRISSTSKHNFLYKYNFIYNYYYY